MQELRNSLANPREKSIECGKCSNILGRIYWRIIYNFNLGSYSLFNSALMRYVNDVNNVPIQSSEKRSEKRSNLVNALVNEEKLSWLRFIEGLKAIQVFRIRITVETWRGKNEDYSKVIYDSEISTKNVEGQEDETQ